MEKRYKVVGTRPAWTPSPPFIGEHDRLAALELKNKYGLPHSLEEIAERWRWYSDEVYAAGWLIDNSQSIEHVFGVILEEINGND